jgi:hypothetical protein
MEVTAFPITIQYAANDYYDVSAATTLLSITISMNVLRASSAVCSMGAAFGQLTNVRG